MLQIPSPRKNDPKPYDAKNYQSDASSWQNYQSNASSWRFDMSVMSNNMLDKSLDKSFNSSFGTSGSEEVIITNDGGDSLSDSSDDTSYSTWKGPPPPDKRIHRYLDEMRVSSNHVAVWGVCNTVYFKVSGPSGWSLSWCPKHKTTAVKSCYSRHLQDIVLCPE